MNLNLILQAVALLGLERTNEDDIKHAISTTPKSGKSYYS